MITTAILLLIYIVLSPLILLITILPDVALNGGIATSITTASAYLSALNTFLPVSTLIVILGTFTAYELGYFSFKLIYWIIKRIPTQS